MDFLAMTKIISSLYKRCCNLDVKLSGNNILLYSNYIMEFYEIVKKRKNKKTIKKYYNRALELNKMIEMFSDF